MRNIAKNTVLVLTITVLSIMQVSASTIDTNSKSGWTNFLSFFKHKASVDYVAEDSLLNKYMLSSTEIEFNETANSNIDVSENLLSNYMFGAQEADTEISKIIEEKVLAQYMNGKTEATEQIALKNDSTIAYAADLEDEEEPELTDYVADDNIFEKY